MDSNTLGYDLSKAGADFPLKTKTGNAYISLLAMKVKLQEEGIFCFDDAYILAKKCLNQYPKFKIFLQQRFGYVFVDEMQDMDGHQYDLLEDIFYDNGSSHTNYQRIGDKNQSIFSENVKLKDIWNDRDIILPLTGSRRLPKTIAEVVKPFALKEQPIDGKNNTNINGSENNIRPHVIIFDDNSIKKVVPKFCELVNEFKNEGKIPANHRHSINAIAWRSGKDGKFGLKNYWNQYDPTVGKTNTDQPCLKSYVLLANGKTSDTKGLRVICQYPIL